MRATLVLVHATGAARGAASAAPAQAGVARPAVGEAASAAIAAARPAAGGPGDSNSGQTVLTGSSGVGDNTASWGPTASLSVPAAAVGGTYAGTLTQSVA